MIDGLVLFLAITKNSRAKSFFMLAVIGRGNSPASPAQQRGGSHSRSTSQGSVRELLFPPSSAANGTDYIDGTLSPAFHVCATEFSPCVLLGRCWK